jgi:superfamily II DNA or RNA helicase
MPKIIIKNNTTAQITEETDAPFLLELDKHLSFYQEGAEYLPSFKGYVDRSGQWVKWDGYKHLITPTLLFPIGLVPRVQTFYADKAKPVELIDKRNAKSPNTPIDIQARLTAIKKEPYDYQLRALDAAMANNRGIVKVATGGGKSLIAALIVAAIGKKTILYVIGKDLLYQFHALFTEVFERPIGIVGDGLCEIHDITIASIWTVGQAFGMKKSDILLDNEEKETEVSKAKYEDIKKAVLDSRTAIIDECHMSACETIQTIFKQSKGVEHLYGLSGTPYRDDGADLMIEGVLGGYIVDIPASELIERGFLAKPIIRFQVVPPIEEPEKNYKAIYKAYITHNEVRNKMIINATKMLVDKGYQTLVLFSSIKHGETLYELHEAMSKEIECVLLDGSDDKEARDAAKADIVSGKVKAIIASRIFDIGLDLPSLSGLVLAGGGKSSVRALQRIGRVIRRIPGSDKNQAAVVDFVDNATYLLNHSKARYKAYKTEKGFDVVFPGKPKKAKRDAKD